MCPWSWRNGDTSSLIRSWQNRRSLMRACWQNQSGGLEWWSGTVTGHPPLPTISPPALPQDGAELFSPLILPPGTSFNWNRCSNDFPLASMQLTILFASYLNHEHFSCLNFQPDTRVLDYNFPHPPFLNSVHHLHFLPLKTKHHLDFWDHFVAYNKFEACVYVRYC